MKNSFPNNLRYWFDDAWECWHCRKNHNDCLHHIVGRGLGDSKCERSILNAAPLNNFNCHIEMHGELRNPENVQKFLNKTYNFLINREYKFNETDFQFLEKYSKFY